MGVIASSVPMLFMSASSFLVSSLAVIGLLLLAVWSWVLLAGKVGVMFLELDLVIRSAAGGVWPEKPVWLVPLGLIFLVLVFVYCIAKIIWWVFLREVCCECTSTLASRSMRGSDAPLWLWLLRKEVTVAVCSSLQLRKGELNDHRWTARQQTLGIVQR